MLECMKCSYLCIIVISKCRACGYIVCGECSKYRARLAGIPEEAESRVCCNCYKGNEIAPGGRFSPTSSFNASFDMDIAARDKKKTSVISDNIYASPIDNDMQRQALIEEEQQKRQIEEFERSQARNYAHSYRIMRGIVPPDIASTNLSVMLRQGLPPLVAKRVWSCGALWLICMHSSDIGKIHIADLRSRYATVGLDIVEMRAIWNVLPKWSYDDIPNKQKAEWRDNFKIKLDSLARAEMDGTISPEELRHPAYKDEEPILVYNHRIPLDAKYDKIDTYGHVIYTGIDGDGNTAAIQFYSDPNPVKETAEDSVIKNDRKEAVSETVPDQELDCEESNDNHDLSPSVAATPSTAAQGRTPGSMSPVTTPAGDNDNSPISRLTQSVAGEVDDSTPGIKRRASSRGVAASRYTSHLESKASDVPPPPAGGSAKASPRRRPPPLPASSISPLTTTRNKAPDSWLNSANMPASPEPSEAALSPAPTVPVIDPNAETPPPGEPSSWKPALNPDQRIGGGYGAASFIPDSDDERTPNRTPGSDKTNLTPSTTPGIHHLGTPSFSPLVASSSSSTPVQDMTPIQSDRPIEISLSDLKGMLLKGDVDSINELFDGNVHGCRNLRVAINPEFTVIAASQLFMQLCREPASMKNPKETFIILVKDFHVDVNYVSTDGKSGLIALLLQPELAKVIINLGGSVLQKGSMTACPLSISLELADQGILDDDWVVDAFERSNSFNSISRGDAMEYFSVLIKCGRHHAAERLVASKRVQVSASDASKIMKECNFETMKDSLECYELLERLGGQF